MNASTDSTTTTVYGLVLSGGASRRMQHDKALIDYHGEPQLLWTYRLLASVLPRVFISVRNDQRNEPLRRELPQIVDAYEDAGPAAGILSAQALYPDVAWLVVACDLPRLDAATLQHLLQARDPKREATAFVSSHDGLPEPLCALWEPASHAKLLARVEEGRSCPRKALIQGDTQLLQPYAADALDNINTPEELATLRAALP
ncbi:NTP transferase domain-containing protein [Rhodanobacter sp. MP1X3]|jgi:molybdenum cofactor guanylyltransferase|uniref:NTP transferase domain-containing protein n=1 Tax=Rhodanobacter sp. MP1X3 TaxID=2723086 RepID=UPI0016117348|nr:NTP transferase domain-containing protein [Rhodanobacter sp. MP1X3]MBB6241699.1 molybdopterin-guanine dinucleotide biosynthesis protein A [Rhodanobacter sp. MP1X3]